MINDGSGCHAASRLDGNDSRFRGARNAELPICLHGAEGASIRRAATPSFLHSMHKNRASRCSPDRELPLWAPPPEEQADRS